MCDNGIPGDHVTSALVSDLLQQLGLGRLAESIQHQSKQLQQQ